MADRLPLPGLALLVLVILAAGSFLAMRAGAADQGEVSISTTRLNDSWDGATFNGGTPTKTGCTGDALCDRVTLNVDGIDADYWDTHRGGVEVQVVPTKDDGADFDLYVEDKDGTRVASGTSAGSTTERVMIPKATAAASPYKVTIMPYVGAQDASYKGGVRLESRVEASADAIPTEPVSDKPCVDGKASAFPCKGVDLEAFLPLKSIDLEGSQDDAMLNDIWGWTDPSTGREYALVGKTNATAFVDVTDAKAPKFLGELPSHQPVETLFNSWRDIKVYKDSAYIVSEEPTHGMQVFDLKQLRGVTAPKTFGETFHYSFVADGPASLLDPPDPERGGLFTLDNAHNISIDEETGVAYAIGTSTCGGGGSHMIDLRDQTKKPTFLGCDSTDSYTHDNQCVVYRGPDAEHAGEEICFNSNEDTLTITKVAEKDGSRLATPQILSRKDYPDSSYTHQGWLTKDSRRFLVNDELDEQEAQGVDKTQTYVWNVDDLDAASLQSVYKGVAESIDHNMYTKGDRLFQANYRSGLRVLDTSQANSGALSEKGFFDIYPEDDRAEFNGMWSNYPYFKSGTVIASGIEQGLFVLRPAGDVGAAADASSPGSSGGAGAGTDGGTTRGVTSASGAPARGKTARRLRVGLGGHRYGRVRRGAFPVRCRLSTSTRRTCRVVATYKGRRVGSGRRVIRRSGVVKVKLSRYGRALLRRRPKGTTITLQARARDGRAVVTSARRARLR